MKAEYKMHIDTEKKAQPMVVFLSYPIQSICAIVFFVLSLILIGLGLAFSLELLKWGIFVYFPAALLIAFCVNKRKPKEVFKRPECVEKHRMVDVWVVIFTIYALYECFSSMRG